MEKTKSIQVEKENHRKLKLLSAITEKQIKDLINEAFEYLFENYKEVLKND